jgi:hypothetical protein
MLLNGQNKWPKKANSGPQNTTLKSKPHLKFHISYFHLLIMYHAGSVQRPNLFARSTSIGPCLVRLLRAR